METFQPNEWTEKLVVLCNNSNWNPDIASLRNCIENGADIFGKGTSIWEPFLHVFVKEGAVDLVIECLKSSNPVDFTTVGSCKRTVLHNSSGGTLSNECSASIIKSIVERTERHPEDSIDWGQKDDHGNDFLSLATLNQKFSLMWEYVKNVPFFADSEKIVLHGTVWQWDWDRLPQEDQGLFKISDADFVDADFWTGKLVKLSRIPKAEVSDLEECVDKGAIITFQDPETLSVVFHQLIWDGKVDAIRACLQTSSPIDFTLRDMFGFTPLQYVLVNGKTSEKVISILSLLVDRIESHTEDKVNWFEKDLSGDDIFSTAAAFGMLSILWTTIRKVKFFSSMSRPIFLTRNVELNEWNELPENDRKFTFCAMKGFR